MKKIKDERLIIRNLKNIRLSFIIENGALLAVLGWQLGQGQAWSRVVSYQNPLFSIFMLAAVSLTLLSLNVSVPMEDKPRASWGQLVWHGLICWVIAWLFCWGLLRVNPLAAVGLALIFTVIFSGIELVANHLRDPHDDVTHQS
ncbi:hypothetical protein [Lactiplantibacillus plajomi]|uniref:Integral membrane protein n=1 Tax=Lactiplantibacillus plajomi TaxID=1457217 RepID=A0ABV6K1X7_9LACO|nr:hypothetical protein [Lactiplantibacillus plajomi]